MNDSTCVFFDMQVSTQRRRWPSPWRFAVAQGTGVDEQPLKRLLRTLTPPPSLPCRWWRLVGSLATAARRGWAAAALRERRPRSVHRAVCGRPGATDGGSAALYAARTRRLARAGHFVSAVLYVCVLLAC